MDKERILRELERLLDDNELIGSERLAKLDAILWILFPRGVKPVQYAELVRTIRVLDRLCDWHDAASDSPLTRSDTAPPLGRDLSTQPANHQYRSQLSGLDTPGRDADYEPTYRAARDRRPQSANLTEGAPVVAAPVDDEATAPIIDHRLFSKSVHAARSWQPKAGFELRERLTEREAPASYTSIFKLAPDSDNAVPRSPDDGESSEASGS